MFHRKRLTSSINNWRRLPIRRRKDQAHTELRAEVSMAFKQHSPSDVLLVYNVLKRNSILKDELQYATSDEIIEQVMDLVGLVLVEGSVGCLVALFKFVAKIHDSSLMQHLLLLCERYDEESGYLRGEQPRKKHTGDPASRSVKFNGADRSDVDREKHYGVWKQQLDKVKPKQLKRFVKEMKRVLGQHGLMNLDPVRGCEALLKEKLKKFFIETYEKSGYMALRVLLEHSQSDLSNQLLTSTLAMQTSLTALRKLTIDDYTMFESQIRRDIEHVSTQSLGKIYEDCIRLGAIRRKPEKLKPNDLRAYLTMAIVNLARCDGCWILVNYLQLCKQPFCAVVRDRAHNLMEYGARRNLHKTDWAVFEKTFDSIVESKLREISKAAIKTAVDRSLFYQYIKSADKDTTKTLAGVIKSRCLDFSATLMQDSGALAEYIDDIVNILCGSDEDDNLMWKGITRRFVAAVSQDQFMFTRVSAILAQHTNTALKPTVKEVSSSKVKATLLYAQFEILQGTDNRRALADVFDLIGIDLPEMAIKWIRS